MNETLSTANTIGLAVLISLTVCVLVVNAVLMWLASRGPGE